MYYTDPMTIQRLLNKLSLCACVVIGLPALAQTPSDAAPQARQVFDRTLTGAEKEFVSLVEAMPADKFGFAPKDGKFDGVRTFGVQARHAAYVINELAAALLGEKTPPTGPNENGPDDLTGKEQIVQYVKDAFANAHKAVAAVTNGNMLEQMPDAFNPKGKRTRVDSLGIMVWHTFDHYGQMVVYARMNGIVPPASR